MAHGLQALKVSNLATGTIYCLVVKIAINMEQFGNFTLTTNSRLWCKISILQSPENMSLFLGTKMRYFGTSFFLQYLTRLPNKQGNIGQYVAYLGIPSIFTFKNKNLKNSYFFIYSSQDSYHLLFLGVCYPTERRTDD